MKTFSPFFCRLEHGRRFCFSVALVFLLLLLAACSGSDKKVQTETEVATPQQDAASVVHRLPRLHVQDTCHANGNAYSWEIDRMAVDSLGIVQDDMGYRYVDNSVKLQVYRNGSVLFAKTFHKADFAHLLSKDFLSKSILDGCRFIQVEDGIISFALAVSYPDSDMSQPFRLTIAPDGSTALQKSNEVEDVYLPDSLLNR